MFEGNLKNVCQKAVKTNLSSFCSESNVQCFVIMLWKWMKFENRLTFIYYSVTFWNFKSLQSVSKTWQMLKTKKIFLQKSSKYWSTVYPDFSLFFPIITSTVYCSKYCFSTIFFPKSRNTSPPPPLFFLAFSERTCYLWDTVKCVYHLHCAAWL